MSQNFKKKKKETLRKSIYVSNILNSTKFKKILAFFKHITNTIIYAESEINILVLKSFVIVIQCDKHKYMYMSILLHLTSKTTSVEWRWMISVLANYC